MRRALMRRPLALAVATLSVVTTLAAVPGSASAATGTLTVTTLGRDGSVVRTDLHFEGAQNLVKSSGTSGTAISLPNGPYVVLTNIYTAKDLTQTLAGIKVNVSGNTKVTIDARKGLLVKMAFSPAATTGYQYIHATACADVNSRPFAYSAGGYPDKIYLIPNDATEFSLGALLIWHTGTAGTLAKPAAEYWATAGASGLPRNFNRTVSRSGLVNVTASLRRGPTRISSTNMYLTWVGGGCTAGLSDFLVAGDSPVQQKLFLSPGPWRYTVDSNHGSLGNIPYIVNRTYASGKNYGQAFYAAAWGPGATLPYVSGRAISFSTDAMFGDPAFAGHQPTLHDSQSVVTLRHGNTLLATTHRNSYDWFGPFGSSFFTHSLTTSGWYTLTVDAHRARPRVTYPGGMLSPRTTLSMRFHADPAKSEVARVFGVFMSPESLSLWNEASPGSTTPVTLSLSRQTQLGGKLVATYLKSITAQASFDGGTTWRSVKVTGSGAKWTAQVPNPASGAVTLRTTAISTTGDSSTTTIYRAYAIA